jgi:hypothetical protein
MKSRSNRPTASRLARMVLDRSGRRWRIAETVIRTSDLSEEPRLVLSTDNYYVSLRNYPDQWMSLTVEELRELAEVDDRESNPPARTETSHQGAEGAVLAPSAVATSSPHHALTK